MNPTPEILIVEDNPGDVLLYERALRARRPEARLHVVTDGDAALAFLRSCARLPDLVLLDLNLPRRDGREVLAEMKMDPVLAPIPVLVISSSEAESDISRSYQLSANCFLTKPLNLDELVRTLELAAEFWLTVARLPEKP
jgi:CheY-like chemotaxis protein